MKNCELYSKYADKAESIGVIFGGRLADYKYYDMDVTVRKALDMYREVSAAV